MARNKESGGDRDRGRESMNTGDMGKRNRGTPGRSVSELGLDPDEARGQSVLGAAGIGSDARPGVSDDVSGGGGNLAGTAGGGERRNPPLVEDAGLGDGGIRQSGGAAGGDRGHAGTSDRGAGGPLGEMRSGPGQYKSTSRGDLDRGSDEDDAPSDDR
ncbi:MAG: hypothetical protein ABR499_08735 [Gemmatimonadaceae bacterium]